MNAVAEAEPDVTFAHAAVPLLKEYATKLQELGTGVLRYSADSSGLFASSGLATVRDELIGRFKHLRAPVEELVRQSSAVLEHGQLTGPGRLELWLRLAELEHYLDVAARRVEALKAKK